MEWKECVSICGGQLKFVNFRLLLLSLYSNLAALLIFFCSGAAKIFIIIVAFIFRIKIAFLKANSLNLF